MDEANDRKKSLLHHIQCVFLRKLVKRKAVSKGEKRNQRGLKNWWKKQDDDRRRKWWQMRGIRRSDIKTGGMRGEECRGGEKTRGQYATQEEERIAMLRGRRDKKMKCGEERGI